MGFFSKDSPALKADRTDWETPRELFERLDDIWHFDLDVASSDDNALCADHFTVEQDGLKQPWGGRRVWCNPPYGRQIADWVEKAYTEARDNGAIVVMLVPARTDTRWYHDFVTQADEVAFIRGRLKYTLGGVEQNSAPFPSMLVRFGGALVERGSDGRDT